ncbi:MAG: hypothetical protein Q8906_00030 [Bacillota bacterium]|nr:hypothetical protein [Bacillota bacterium]MDP4168958.1 hypothetical protein [Bacillota bacterium]
MKAMQEKLYWELRETEEEIIITLKKETPHEWLKQILRDELKDVRSAIGKLEMGCYGECELSGELLPEGLLEMVPILKSEKDWQNMNRFYKKALETTFL